MQAGPHIPVGARPYTAEPAHLRDAAGAAGEHDLVQLGLLHARLVQDPAHRLEHLVLFYTNRVRLSAALCRAQTIAIR